MNMSVPNNEKSTVGKTIKAGLFSGSIAAIITQPLEVIKTDILVNPVRNNVIEASGPLKSMVVSSQRIWAFEQGGLRNFYRGALIAGARQSLGFATYVSLLKEINHVSQARYAQWKYLTLSLNAVLAKTLAISLTTPLIILKTRMEVLCGSKNSIYATFNQIIKNESVVGLYKGASSVMYREAVFTFVHYGTYTYLKDVLKGHGAGIIHQNVLSAFTAAAIASVVSHPFEVIRNRVQVQPQFLENYKRYSNVLEGVIKIYRSEGLKGYIKGIGPRALKKPINSGVNWVLFDLLSQKKNTH